MILEKEAALKRPIGKIEIVEESAYTSGVYLPMIYGMEGGYSVGDRIHMTIGSSEVSYTVCGFLNSAMAGSHNCSMSALLLTEDLYQELEEKGYASGSLLASVRIRDRAQSEDYEASLKNAVSSRYPDIRMLSNSYTLVSSSRYISQMICAGIVSAMAFLKALGFTTGQLILQTALCFMPAVMISTMIGIMVSAVVINPLTTLFLKGIGIVKCTFAVPAGFITAAGFGLILFTFGIACLLSLGIRKITPRALLTGE